MTDDDDPFGARDRTVIRPNPAGRRGPAQPAPPPPGGARPSATPVPPVSYPTTGPNPPPPRTAGWPSQAPRPNPSAQNPQSSGDPWNWTGGPAPPRRDLYERGAAPPPMIPAPISPHIAVDLFSVSTDPLMRSASSLLLILGRLRVSLSQANAIELMDQVAQAIEAFEREAKDAKAPPEQIQAAKYALAATADDIVQNLPNLDPRIWTQYSMLVRFFRERTGGVRFYEELRKAKENPALNIGLLELMHACLSLGFEGKYRATGNFGELQAVRRDLYEAIRRNRPKTIEDLSPHWRGQPIALAGSRFRVPVWAVTSAALALLLVVYVVLRWLLANQLDALLARVALPHDLVAIAREAPVKKVAQPPAPKTTQYQRITSALEQEIGDGRLTPDQTPSRIILRIGSFTLFAQAEAKVNDSFLPTAEKIAATLDKEPGKIFVDGYTDSDPIRTIQYPSNSELSQARAANVAKILRSSLRMPDRVVASGRADTNPVAPNDKEENKAKNRRVEISIERAD